MSTTEQAPIGRLRRALSDHGRIALVIVDLQRDILSTDLEPSGEQVATNAGRLERAIRAQGGTIVHIHHDGNPIRRRPLATDLPTSNGTGEVREVEFTDRVGHEPEDVIVGKRQWGAFYGTDLDQQLRARDVGTIVLVGVATNFGVESTAREAFQRGYQLVFTPEAMGTIDAEHQQFAVAHVLPRLGCVASVDAVIEALSPSETNEGSLT